MKLTKDELLKIISESTWKDDPDRDKSALYDKYYPLLKEQLRYCPSDLNFSGLSSLGPMHDKDKFESFIISTDASGIAERFEIILDEIKTVARNVMEKEKEKDKRYAAETCGKFLRKQSIRRHVVSGILIGIILTASLAVITLAMLEWFEVIGDDSGRWGGLAGVVDLVVGVIFFVYEQIEDRRQKEVCECAQRIAPGLTVEGNTVKGNGNNVGIFIRGEDSDRGSMQSMADEQDQRKAQIQHLEDKVFGNKVKGKDNNVGIFKSGR